MDSKNLRGMARKLGIRVTKDVNNRRVKLSDRDLYARIRAKATDAKKIIRICRDVIVTPGFNAGMTQVRTVYRPSSTAPAPPPPPPPPPPPSKKPINNKRARLMSELKMTLKKKGLAK
jgi:hypothetical protein